MTIKIAVIDGTGPAEGYEQAMEHSFCHTLASKLKQDSYWQRGPTWHGLQVLPEAFRAAEWLLKAKAADKSAKLMLAGYSRGGSAAIMAAEMLERGGVEVDSMFLFDPVARHNYPGGEIIPANVRFSRTARRDQSWSWVMRWEGTISDGAGATSNPTRPSFSNTGLRWRGTGDHRHPEVFTGSHGALGGVGWGFMQEFDQPCMKQVSLWMHDRMKERGLDVDMGIGELNKEVALKPGRITKGLGMALDAGMIGKSALNRLGGGLTF